MPQLGPGIFPGDDTDKLGQHPLIGRIGVGHQHGTFAVKRLRRSAREAVPGVICVDKTEYRRES